MADVEVLVWDGWLIGILVIIRLAQHVHNPVRSRQMCMRKRTTDTCSLHIESIILNRIQHSSIHQSLWRPVVSAHLCSHLCTCTHTHQLTHPISLTHFLSHTDSHTLTLTHSTTLTLTRTHSHTHSLSQTDSLTHTHLISHTHLHMLTHTHSLSPTPTHSL